MEKMIEKTDLYECHEDYFYAYKNIRSDRYSHFNFQYQYLPGETYNCFQIIQMKETLSDYLHGQRQNLMTIAIMVWL